MTSVTIIGAGPAGLMAALAAAEHGATVTVCESLPRPGAKLLATGGGKCNLTNILAPFDLAMRFGRQGRFLLPALAALPPDALRQWLAAHGVPTTVTDGFHVFPVSQRAGDVLAALLENCRTRNVTIRTDCPVTELQLRNGAVTGVLDNDGPHPADRVILAAGGKGYPALGGRGAGYELARQAGHELVEPTPGLVGLQTAETWPGTCTGISFADSTVTIALPKYRQLPGRGELLFTHHGISGPAVIDLSAEVGVLLRKHPAGIPLTLHLRTDCSPDWWNTEFDRWQREDGKKHLVNLLSPHVTHAVAEALCAAAGNIAHRKAAEFTAAERENLTRMLTAAPVTAIGSDGWEKAMVTRGGVSLKKVDPNTLQSRLVDGLYFAGEVLDLDGPCGGFNLQWAFSSGWLAGTSAASSIAGSGEDTVRF